MQVYLRNEKLRKDAIAKGETLPEEDKFDSNSITPGLPSQCYHQKYITIIPVISVVLKCL